MIETIFLLKFYPHKRENKIIKSLIVKVKLDKAIHGAKFFEIRRTFFYSLTRGKVFRSDLVNQSNYFVNNLNPAKKFNFSQRLLKIIGKSSHSENILPTDFF